MEGDCLDYFSEGAQGGPLWAASYPGFGSRLCKSGVSELNISMHAPILSALDCDGVSSSYCPDFPCKTDCNLELWNKINSSLCLFCFLVYFVVVVCFSFFFFWFLGFFFFAESILLQQKETKLRCVCADSSVEKNNSFS